MRTSKLLVIALIWLLLPINAQARTTVDDETPLDIWESAITWGEYYNICPELIIAVCYQESRFKTDAVNDASGCYGVMQIQEKSHRARIKRLGVTDLMDVDQNIHVGADYLHELFEQYEDVGVVLGMYHGERTAETQLSSYTDAVLKNSERLERLHEK